MALEQVRAELQAVSAGSSIPQQREAADLLLQEVNVPLLRSHLCKVAQVLSNFCSPGDKDLNNWRALQRPCLRKAWRELLPQRGRPAKTVAGEKHTLALIAGLHDLRNQRIARRQPETSAARCDRPLFGDDFYHRSQLD